MTICLLFQPLHAYENARALALKEHLSPNEKAVLIHYLVSDKLAHLSFFNRAEMNEACLWETLKWT